MSISRCVSQIVFVGVAVGRRFCGDFADERSGRPVVDDDRLTERTGNALCDLACDEIGTAARCSGDDAYGFTWIVLGVCIYSKQGNSADSYG